MSLKARAAEPVAIDGPIISTLEWSDGSGPYCDISLSLRGRPVRWNETTKELIIGLPLVHDEQIDSALYDVTVKALPSLDESEHERITEKLSLILHRESVRIALLALVKEN